MDTATDIQVIRKDTSLISMVANFARFRAAGEMLDFEIVVGPGSDSEVLLCHRVVLAACSPVLYRMIVSGMTEGQSKKVTMDGLEPDILKQLVDYMYTGVMCLKSCELTDMLQACDYLEMLDVKEQIVDHLPRVLSSNNAVSWYRLAESLNLKQVKEQVFGLFVSLIKEPEFLGLEYEECRNMLRDGKRRDVKSAHLLQAALAWMADPEPQPQQEQKRSVKIEELLAEVAVENVPWDILKDIVLVRYQEFVKQYPVFYRILVNAQIHHYCVRALVTESRKQMEQEELAAMKRGSLKQSLIEFTHHVQKSIGHNVPADLLLCRIFHWVEHDRAHRVQYLDQHLMEIELHGCTWSMLRILMLKYKRLLQEHPSFYRLFTHKLLRHKNNLSLLVVGAVHKKYKMWRVSKGKKPMEVSKLPPDLVSAGYSICRYRHTGLILTGGLDGHGKVCAVYNARSQQWMRHMNMREERFRHVSVCLSELLFVLGGDLGKAGWSRSMHCHNMDSVTWHDASPLPCPLEFPKVTSYGNKIYAMGDNNQQLLVYDTSHNKWSSDQRPTNPGYGFSMAAWGGRVYIAGGTKKVCSAYCLLTGHWISLTGPLKRHIGGVLTVHGGRLMLLGGDGEDSLDEYDMEEDCWNVSELSLPDALHPDHAYTIELV